MHTYPCHTWDYKGKLILKYIRICFYSPDCNIGEAVSLDARTVTVQIMRFACIPCLLFFIRDNFLRRPVALHLAIRLAHRIPPIVISKALVAGTYFWRCARAIAAAHLADRLADGCAHRSIAVVTSANSRRRARAVNASVFAFGLADKEFL